MLFDPSNPDAFWLDVTNAALGVFCAICLVAIAWGVWQDLMVRRRQRSIHVVHDDPHAHFDPQLGASMADGGRPVDRDAARDREEHRVPREDS